METNQARGHAAENSKRSGVNDDKLLRMPGRLLRDARGARVIIDARHDDSVRQQVDVGKCSITSPYEFAALLR